MKDITHRSFRQKLSDEQKHQLFLDYIQDDYVTQREIAQRYGVSPRTVSIIVCAEHEKVHNFNEIKKEK